jgi:hypothetical protein
MTPLLLGPVLAFGISPLPAKLVTTECRLLYPFCCDEVPKCQSQVKLTRVRSAVSPFPHFKCR